jgi:hypothetical protein
VSVDEKIAVGGILILTVAELGQWWIGQRGKPLFKERTRLGYAFWTNPPVACVRVKCWAMAVERELRAC